MRTPAASGVEPQVVERVEHRLMRRAAARLSPRDQEVLRLSLWEELSHGEAAEALGISVDAVKQRLHRAKARLARRYRRLERQKDGAAEGGEA